MADPLNPMGTDGFEFIEFVAPEPAALEALFTQLGFVRTGLHRTKRVALWQQGDIHFIVNAEPASFGADFARLHGPSVCAFAFRVGNAADAYRRALELGAEGVPHRAGPMELNLPAIRGIGGACLYLVERFGEHSLYDVDFRLTPADTRGCGLTGIDHLTHNVERGHMDDWAGFYQQLFNFREIRYFDIEGKLTGLRSRAMTSPCGKIRIPINESADDRSQIEEYLRAYHGEGVQHIALGCDDIYATVEALRTRGVRFLDTPDSYYDGVDARLPGHGEDLERLRRDRILIDGSPGGGRLLQIFTDTVIGPIFFEIIQRKGDEGFGEGNFRALFEAIERDQVARGVLSDTGAPQ